MLLRTGMVIHKIVKLKIIISENFGHKVNVKCGDGVLTIKTHT